MKAYDIKLKKDEEFYWFLGVLCGDGCISGNKIKLNTIDYEMAYRFHKFLKGVTNNNSKIYTINPKKDNRELQYCVSIGSVNLINYLKKSYGSFGTSGWDIPKEVMNGNRDKKISFIRGFVDSEGGVCLNKLNQPFISITSINKRSLEKLNNLILSLGINSRYYTQSHRADIFMYRKEEVLKFSKVIGFSIRRKQAKLINGLKKFDWTRNYNGRRWKRKKDGVLMIQNFIEKNPFCCVNDVNKKLRCSAPKYIPKLSPLFRKAKKKWITKFIKKYPNKSIKELNKYFKCQILNYISSITIIRDKLNRNKESPEQRKRKIVCYFKKYPDNGINRMHEDLGYHFYDYFDSKEEVMSFVDL